MTFLHIFHQFTCDVYFVFVFLIVSVMLLIVLARFAILFWKTNLPECHLSTDRSSCKSDLNIIIGSNMFCLSYTKSKVRKAEENENVVVVVFYFLTDSKNQRAPRWFSN